jgi:hypothetical protein
MLINFEPAGRNRWDIRIDGRKKGVVVKERGKFVADLTRHVVPHTALDVICFFVAELNRQC